MVTVILPAAGQGKRMNQVTNKVLLPLLGRPVLVHTVLAVSACPEVDNIVIAAAPQEVGLVHCLLAGLEGVKPWQVVAGGTERQYSIANALTVIPQTVGIILVHDAARPLIRPDMISRMIAAAREFSAAGLAVPLKDTIKRVDSNGFVVETPPRSTMWIMQTPQAFTADILRAAYRQATQDGFLGTDDASLVERLGVRVKLIEGCYSNVKLTTQEDIVTVEALMRKDCEDMLRFGMGYDVHRLVEGRKLILGGVEVPHTYGLDGHSDADVLLHAIKDALLGAAALGDIGRHFPDSDPRYKGISSLILLGKVRDIIAAKGYQVNNIDATIVAEKPKLAPYIERMNANIAAELEIAVDMVNVKATTTEGLGFAGKKEGIAAYAVASIVKNTIADDQAVL
ncbi:2-C-methyl-D-erythritol 2,4-cyclodiphosphate synthase [Propionispora vibrioides]|uniref:Bifunctional enzyme IspD/IspF n=2 Tax=Propionispora vibrioides TaxID=112903 RepID=A0A1H8XYH3_9FIRM|nr:2-C-methyl-D-erythritol 4-phosphate cytidylyltransferase [Propionispora vibrioides]SEP44802.1 2-C-methyl-D-erythritol 2,4-cyclodiphosphate synthase [Propionispora vibrioides]